MVRWTGLVGLAKHKVDRRQSGKGEKEAPAILSREGEKKKGGGGGCGKKESWKKDRERGPEGRGAGDPGGLITLLAWGGPGAVPANRCVGSQARGEKGAKMRSVVRAQVPMASSCSSGAPGGLYEMGESEEQTDNPALPLSSLALPSLPCPGMDCPKGKWE